MSDSVVCMPLQHHKRLFLALAKAAVCGQTFSWRSRTPFVNSVYKQSLLLLFSVSQYTSAFMVCPVKHRGILWNTETAQTSDPGNCCSMLTSRVLFLHENARPHIDARRGIVAGRYDTTAKLNLKTENDESRELSCVYDGVTCVLYEYCDIT